MYSKKVTSILTRLSQRYLGVHYHLGGGRYGRWEGRDVVRNQFFAKGYNILFPKTLNIAYFYVTKSNYISETETKVQKV